MARVVVVTEDEALRDRLRESILRTGHPVRTAPDWDGLLRELVDPACGLLLVDGRLPGLLPTVLTGLSRSLAHRPRLRTLIESAAPIEPVDPQDLPLLVSRSVARVPGTDRHELRLLGLGRDTFKLLDVAANADLPVLFVGEAGTGKKRLARAVHRRTGALGPFHEGTEVPEGPPGTLYIAGRTEDVDDIAHRARERRWRVCAGLRAPLPLPAWRHVTITPLRERQDELRKLLNLYLERYRQRLGLPRRRLDRPLWKLVRRHRWPGNARELEGFVVQCLTSTRGNVIRAADLPDRVRGAIDLPASAPAWDHARALEAQTEEQLAPLFETLEPDSGVPMRRLAVEATERALIRLALKRTSGDQKAAAQLLGLARNTLRAKGIEYGLIHPRKR